MHVREDLRLDGVVRMRVICVSAVFYVRVVLQSVLRYEYTFICKEYLSNFTILYSGSPRAYEANG